MELIRFALILLVPGLIGALAFSISSRLRMEINILVALILDLLTFTAMITGLYFFKDVTTMEMLMFQFTCLSFTRRYILLSILINILLGAGIGLLRRLFFWIRR
jgi:hypothetical protein